MSKVHDAMRQLEHKSAPETGSSALNNMVVALIEELADEVPDDPRLETVRADLLAVSRSYETSKKKDIGLRFYLAMRSLFREYELLQERLKKAERKAHDAEPEKVEPDQASEATA
jgi:hypothetical protein